MRLTAAVLLAASLLAAAGCGSTSSNTTTSSEAAATAWAGGVCLAFSEYKQNLQNAATSFRANPTKNQLVQSVTAVQSAATQARNRLQAVGPPPEESREGKQAIETLRSEIASEVDAIHAISENVSSVQEAKAAAPKVRAELDKMQTALQTAVHTVKSLPSGAIATGFQNAPNCQSLGG